MFASENMPDQGVKSIEIKGLFGEYHYSFPRDGQMFGSVVIFYGDNGVGKTTLLKLVFHMLSPAQDGGHRNAIARVPFNKVNIVLNNGKFICAQRPEDPHSLSYEILFGETGKKLQKVSFDLDSGRSSLISKDSAREYRQFLSDINLAVYLLSADREFRSDEWDENDRSHRERNFDDAYRHRAPLGEKTSIQTLRHKSLNKAISAANVWIAKKAAAATNEGTDSVNKIYEDVVLGILSSTGSASDDSLGSILIEGIDSITAISEDFSKFGFTPEIKTSKFTESIRSADRTQLETIARVLLPYLSGLEARLTALTDVQKVTESFVGNFKDFFKGKLVSFTVDQGLVFRNAHGKAIEPEYLSSGEQQLLRLFCLTLVSRDRPSIFIIDEPELSLNIKWQRKLIKALTEIADDSEMQFMFATHSIELIAQYQKNVTKLESERGSES